MRRRGIAMKLSEILKDKKEFTVGFIGGSITEGAHAASRAERYSSVLVKLLGERYSAVSFKEINAGIGGTGSNLGLFRAERDLLSGKPDMVFVEFSVNDGLSFSARYHEALVRLLRRYHAKLPIVFVYTLNRPIYADYYAKGILGPVADSLEPIAKAYGIPTVPVAIPLCKAMGDESHYADFMADGVHPNSRGHRVYAEALDEALLDADFDFLTPSTPLTAPLGEHPRMESAEGELSFDGWKKSFNSFFGKFSTYFYAAAPGTELTYDFEGSVIGIYNSIEKDSGDIEFSIDGGAWEKRAVWDTYALQFNRVHYQILKDDLAPTHHTLRLRVCAEQPEKSEGTYVRIGAFLVC